MSCYQKLQKLQKGCLNLHQSKDSWNKINTYGLCLINYKSHHKRLFAPKYSDTKRRDCVNLDLMLDSCSPFTL